MNKRDWRQLFFFSFWFVNNIVLWNVFIGQVINISLVYYQEIIEKKLKEKRIKEKRKEIEKLNLRAIGAPSSEGLPHSNSYDTSLNATSGLGDSFNSYKETPFCIIFRKTNFSNFS